MKIQYWKFECYNLCKGIGCTGQHVTDEKGEWAKREDVEKLLREARSDEARNHIRTILKKRK